VSASPIIVAGKVLNHKRDTAQTIRNARDAGPLLRGVKAAPFVPGLVLPHILSILDQGQLGACTGNGAAQNFRIAMHLAGVTNPLLVSRLWLYWLGRSYDHDTGEDNGAQIGNVFTGAELYGMPNEALWAYDITTFKGPPPPECYRGGFDFKPQGHRINSTGDQLINDVTAALGQGRAVTFGSAVSNAYCSNAFDPTVPLQAPSGSDIAGEHCENVVDRNADGSFKILNSWGESWGGPVGVFAGGSSTFSEDYLLDENSSDFWVVDLVPTTNIVDAGGAS
jgi:hypothetical protein